MPGNRPKVRNWGWMLALLGLVGGCGYHLKGHGVGILTEDIQTIAIPPVEGDFPRSEIQQILTQHITDAFVQRTRRQIVNETATADAVLTTRVLQFNVTPVGWTQTSEARSYQVVIVLNVRLVRTQGRSVVFEHPRWTFRTQFEVDPGTPIQYENLELEAVQRIGDDFARALVSAVLEAF